MAVNNADYQVKITTETDDSGVKKATDGFEKLGKEIPKSTEALKNVASAHEKAGEKGEEAGKKQKEGAEHATLSHRELRESVHAVAREFGGLADVGLWLNPTTAGLAILLTAVEGIKKVFEELKQPVEAADAAIQAINAARLEAAATAAHSLRDALSEIGNEEDRLDAAYKAGDAAIDARIKKYNEEQDAIYKLIEAREKLAEAEIDNAVNNKQMSKEAGEAAKEALRLQLDKDRTGTDLAKQKFLIDTRQKELDEARARLQSGADVKAIASNQKDVDVSNEALKVATANQKAESEKPITIAGGDPKGLFSEDAKFKNEEELEKAIREKNDVIQSMAETGRAGPFSPKLSDAAVQEQTGVLQGQVAAMNQALEAHRKYIANLAEETQTATEANNAAKSRVQTSKERLEKDEDKNRTLPTQIKSLQDSYDLQRTNSAAVQQVNTQAADVRTGGALSAIVPRITAGPAPVAPFDPSHQINVSALETSGEYAISLIKRQQGGVEPQQEPQVHNILHRIISLLESPNVSPRDKDHLRDIESRLEALEHRSPNTNW